MKKGRYVFEVVYEMAESPPYPAPSIMDSDTEDWDSSAYFKANRLNTLRRAILSGSLEPSTVQGLAITGVHVSDGVWEESE